LTVAAKEEENMQTVLEEYQEAKDRGKTTDELLRLMHKRGLTITEAIKAFVQLYGVPVGEAKEKVSASPYWRAIVTAAEPLHDQLAETTHADAKERG
jgi:hypothetical protein